MRGDLFTAELEQCAHPVPEGNLQGLLSQQLEWLTARDGSDEWSSPGAALDPVTRFATLGDISFIMGLGEPGDQFMQGGQGEEITLPKSDLWQGYIHLPAGEMVIFCLIVLQVN